MDQLDASILAVLMQDGRCSNIDVARAVRASEATVRRRIDAMMADGIFQVIAVADAYKIGYTVQAFLFFRVEHSKLTPVAKAIANLQPVRFMVYTTGRYDLFAQAFFADMDELKMFLTEQLCKIPGIIATETSLILGFAKRTWDFQLASPAIRKARFYPVRRKRR